MKSTLESLESLQTLQLTMFVCTLTTSVTRTRLEDVFVGELLLEFELLLAPPDDVLVVVLLEMFTGAETLEELLVPVEL